MSTSKRRRWRAEEKLRILEEARQADQAVSAVCRHYQIAPGFHQQTRNPDNCQEAGWLGHLLCQVSKLSRAYASFGSWL